MEKLIVKEIDNIGEIAAETDFIAIPRRLLKSQVFKDVSNDAKILYIMMKDRMGITRYKDDYGKPYITYTTETAANELHVSYKSAMTYFKQLEDIGLIRRRKRGQGNPAHIYVKRFEVYYDESQTGKKEQV